MPHAAEGDVDAVVPHALAPQPLAHARRVDQIHGPLLEHAGADALDHVIAGAALEDHRIDAHAVQQVTEHQPGRTAADDADLGAGAERSDADIGVAPDCTLKIAPSATSAPRRSRGRSLDAAAGFAPF